MNDGINRPSSGSFETNQTSLEADTVTSAGKLKSRSRLSGEGEALESISRLQESLSLGMLEQFEFILVVIGSCLTELQAARRIHQDLPWLPSFLNKQKAQLKKFHHKLRG